MFITGIVFRGFKLFIHNNIQELHVDFTSRFQLILGTNGCGKSSLMREMTVFPPHKSLFDKDGYRKFYFTHRGSSYYIFNDYSTDKHSIEKDGEVLYDNLNPTMMATVIKQLFNIDRTIADILTDKLKFSSMSPNERREIIMTASGINTDVGLEMLNILREQKTYNKEFLKNLSKRLVTEENNLPSETHVDELNKRRSDILHDLDLLDELKNQKIEIPQEWTIVNEIKKLENVGKTIAYTFLETPKALHSVRDEIDVQDILAMSKYQLQQINEDKRNLSEDIETLSSSLGVSRFSANEEELRKEIEVLKASIDEIRKNSNGFLIEEGDVDYINKTAQEVYENLRDLFNRLPDNSNRYFNKQKRDENSEKILLLNNRLSSYNHSIMSFEHELSLHQNGDKIECPSCKSNFIPGTTASKSEINERLSATQKLHADTTRLLNVEKEYEVEVRNYQNIVVEIENVFKYASQNFKLIDELKTYNYINNPPAYCLGIIEHWFTDVKTSVQYQTLKQRLRTVEDQLAHLLLEDWEKKKNDEERLSKLTRQYSQLIDKTLFTEKIIVEITEYVQYVTKLKAWLTDADKQEALLSDYHHGVLNNKVNDFVFNSKMALNKELGDIDKEINNITYLKHNLDKILQDKELTENMIHDIGIIQDELSTKTGLLGEVMDDFIMKFITQMNNIIKSVWTYVIEILPCRNKKGDLDWYFPVNVMNNAVSEDVKNLSSSQSDIINYAFKRLIMVTYDLEDFPLYNDELSNTMDDTHRVNAMKMIYDTVTSGNCSQMFFISHYAAQHGVFTQAECLVINADNLQTLPESYNTHSKFI